jgi:hypothetical protein
MFPLTFELGSRHARLEIEDQIIVPAVSLI